MMDITFSGGEIDGTISAPASKSCTHRAIILAALSRGKCVITNPLDSLDTRATADAMITMGASIDWADDRICVGSKEIRAPNRIVDVLNSGTTMRLMTGIAALFDSETTIVGDDSVMKRPMEPLLNALKGCGVRCESNDGKAPIRIRGPVEGNRICIDGSTSSQFISSVLMMSPLVGRPMDIILEGDIVSQPYIDITTDMMERFGIYIIRTDSGFHVEPQSYVPCDYVVPSDFSSAAYPLVAGGLSGRASVKGLDMSDQQGDKKIVDILRMAGCSVDIDGDVITCTHNGRPKACDIDISNVPDLFPIVAVLLCTADGKSKLHGAPQLHFKESDRIESVSDMLNTLGADIRPTDDGCIIEGVEHLRGGWVDHRGDHRLMMAASIASLVSDGPISMKDGRCWDVSYPRFIEHMRSLGMRC